MDPGRLAVTHDPVRSDFVDDLPVAIQLAGRCWYCDERLLELGRLAEEILAGRSLTTSAAERAAQPQ